jgi:hypothetical protein
VEGEAAGKALGASVSKIEGTGKIEGAVEGAVKVEGLVEVARKVTGNVKGVISDVSEVAGHDDAKVTIATDGPGEVAV